MSTVPTTSSADEPSPTTTTARLIGRLHSELLDEGLPIDLVGEIVRDAAQGLVRDEVGLVVKA